MHPTYLSKSLFARAVICFIATASSLQLTADTELNIPGYRVQWYDEFEASVVDTTKWDIAEGINAGYTIPGIGYAEPQWFNEDITGWTSVNPINGEQQYYSSNNVSIADNASAGSRVLEIEAREETVINPYGAYDPNFHKYTSGKLNTADEFQFTFGIVKWRAELPVGSGMWPALWMLNSPQPSWFWDDEIDIMEARGNNPFETTSAHHWKNEAGTNLYKAGSLDDHGINLQTSFNEYGLEWDANSLRTTLNDEEVLTDNANIPQGSMFLIMNAAVGGGFGPGPIDEAVLAAGTTFSIDWVRVWQPASTPSDLSNGGFEDFQGPQWADWNTIDDGNLSVVSSNALHGSNSVHIAPLNNPGGLANSAPNLFDNAGSWSGWLNESGPDSSGPIGDLATIPATTNGNTAVMSVKESSPASSANAVIYRQLAGSGMQGLDVTYTGTVIVEEAFAGGATANAFIRVFNTGYSSFEDYFASVTSTGDFTLQATIPASGIEAVQIGFETTGTPGSNGRIAASALRLVDDSVQVPASENRTGFNQTVVVSAAQNIIYGVLASNDASDPLSAGAEGNLCLEFLDTSENVLQTYTTVIVDSSSDYSTTPYLAQATAPSSTAFARLSIERITTVDTSDTGGSFLADAAFLCVDGATELPDFSAAPPSIQNVDAGTGTTLPITVSSTTSLSYQWYFEGTPVSTSEDYSFTPTPASGGRYFVVASNAAGPVIGGWTDLNVTTPDSDNDLVIDYEEINLYGTNPNKADTDGDGDDDYTEIFITQTDPTDPSSLFLLTGVALVGGNVELTFPTVLNVSYTFEASADLVSWQPIGSTHFGNGTPTAVSMALPVTNPPLIYFRASVSE